ncbi:hypothetical protein GSI_06243 [Ganoderma sinense ZZ0214-1]|uniref:Uncharacterized protein n=1 Tax=Ganoderma sinense ZZ0214-1 TaxID=1077348 RepID=A0A2G8SCR6_9APHY|nr:hypothetical protein GSI_06243 [Ganoderma sinense ZZ0214-1]
MRVLRVLLNPSAQLATLGITSICRIRAPTFRVRRTASHYKLLLCQTRTGFGLTLTTCCCLPSLPEAGQTPSEGSSRSLLPYRIHCFPTQPEASFPNLLHRSQPSSKIRESAHGLETTMNSSAVTTVGHWNIPVLAAPCSQDWKILRCSLVLMFDLIRSAARLFLVGSAGAVIGLAGFILSILAYIKEAVGGRRSRKLGADVLAAPESTSPPRDRDHRTRKPRMNRHDRSKRSNDRPRSPKFPGSGSRSTVTSSSPSKGPEEPEQERPGRPRRRRTQSSTREMSSVDDVVVTNPMRPAPTTVTLEVTTEIPPPRRPQRSLSEVSSAQSFEISTRRLSLEEHLPISGRRVLMKIKDSHTTYIQEVVNERQGTYIQPTTSPVAVESNTTNAILIPSPPREKGGTTAHKELFSRLKFGHHRRRHGIGSADSHVTVSTVAS